MESESKAAFTLQHLWELHKAEEEWISHRRKECVHEQPNQHAVDGSARGPSGATSTAKTLGHARDPK
jgi:hypothetical protein